MSRFAALVIAPLALSTACSFNFIRVNAHGPHTGLGGVGEAAVVALFSIIAAVVGLALAIWHSKLPRFATVRFQSFMRR